MSKSEDEYSWNDLIRDLSFRTHLTMDQSFRFIYPFKAYNNKFRIRPCDMIGQLEILLNSEDMEEKGSALFKLMHLKKEGKPDV